MSTWLISQLQIHNPAEYELYVSKTIPTLKKYNGRLILLADKLTLLEGESPLPRTVIIEFENKEIANNWYYSPEYQEIIPIRQRSAKSNIVLIENTLT